MTSEANGSRKLVLIGAGEFAAIAYEYFTHDSPYDVVAFSVERDYLTDPPGGGLPVVPFEELPDHYAPGTVDVFVAVPASDLNRLRTRFYGQCKARGYRLATYISSRAFVWRNAKIGENCFIFEHNTIQPFVEVGNNVIMWSGNHIGHRTVIEDNCFLSSHVVIAGYCRIGSGCFLGVNATFNDRVTVPANCIIASGSLVNKSPQEAERVYYGAPAKMMPKKSSFGIKL